MRGVYVSFFVEGGGLEKIIENPAISGNLSISQSYDKPFWEISAERKEREREKKQAGLSKAILEISFSISC